MIPAYVQTLTNRYRDAQLTLIKGITDAQARGNVTAYKKRILKGVQSELDNLDQYAEQWVNREIPDAYQRGIASSYAAFKRANLVVPMYPVNERALEVLTKNTLGQLQDAHELVGRRINDTIRKAGLEAVSQKVATGSTVQQTKANLIDRLTKQGVTSILDKNGRAMRLDSYASTVARSTTREATNRGTIQHMTDAGYDLVRITSHNSPCAICAVYEGRVYSISGKSKQYPALDEAFKGGYANLHPNCAHSTVPYFPFNDDNELKTKEESNRPFEIDEKGEKKVEKYNEIQKKKEVMRNDRTEWNKALIASPDKTPKTFSGYRALKRKNTEKYKDIKSKLS